MAWYSGIFNGIADLFGGDDEEKKRRQQQSGPSISVVQPKSSQSVSVVQPQAPKQAVSVVQPSSTQAELDRLYHNNLGEAQQQVHQNDNIFDKITNAFTHNDEKNVENLARIKAAQDYHEIHGWKKDQPDAVNRFQAATVQQADQNSEDDRKRVETGSLFTPKGLGEALISGERKFGGALGATLYDWSGQLDKDQAQYEQNQAQSMADFRDVVNRYNAATDPQQKARLRELMGVMANTPAGQAPVSRVADLTAPRKVLTGAAETGLDILTAGTYGSLLPKVFKAGKVAEPTTLLAKASQAAKHVGTVDVPIGLAYGTLGAAENADSTVGDYVRDAGIGGLTAGVLGTGGRVLAGGAGRVARKLTRTVPESELQTVKLADEAPLAETPQLEVFDPHDTVYVNERGEQVPAPTGVRPNEIPTKPQGDLQTPKPGITSANQPAVDVPLQVPPRPAVVPEQPAPQPAVDTQLIRQIAPEPVTPTPEEIQAAKVQQELNKSVTQPAPLPGAVEGAPVQTPLEAETLARAETTPPVDPQVVAQAEAEAKAAKAPTEAIADELSSPGAAKDPLAALKQEALKYKSADEFVNSQSTKNLLGADVKGDVLTEKDLNDIIATHHQRFGDKNVSFGETNSPDALAQYSPANDKITLRTGKADMNAYNHETVHKAIAQYLTNSEKKQLFKDVVRVRGGKKALADYYKKQGYSGDWMQAAEEEASNHFNTFLKEGSVQLERNGAEGLARWAAFKGYPQSLVRIFLKLSSVINDKFGRNAAAERIGNFYKNLGSGTFRDGVANPFAKEGGMSFKLDKTTGPSKQQLTDLYNQAHAEAKGGVSKPVADDPRIAQADAHADELIKAADEALKSSGSSYGELVLKLRNNSLKDKPYQDLTSVERQVASTIQPQLNRVAEKLNMLGLTDDDVRRIVDYLPTTRKDALSEVRTVEDVAARDLGFSKSRAKSSDKALSDEEVVEGAEQALKDYLRVGALVDDLSPETIKTIKRDRLNDDFNKMISEDINGGATEIHLTDEEQAAARNRVSDLVEAEAERTKAQEKVRSGDNSPEAISKLNKAEDNASQALIDKRVQDYILLEKKTDERIRSIKNSKRLNPKQKKAEITQLESHLTDVRNQTYYLQSTVRTNLLFGVGRIADQVNKGAQAVSDKLTAGARVGGNRSFAKSAGRNLYADGPTVKAVYKQVASDPRLNQAKTNAKVAQGILQAQNKDKGLLSKGFSLWRQKGTLLTEAGSRYKIASKDTVSFFVSKARAEGMTDVNEITDYVRKNIGTKEWGRVHQAFFDARNSFTGLPVAGNVSNKDFRISLRNATYNALGQHTNLSRSMRENIADALSIPVVGFPRLIFRLGARGLDNATLGVGDFIKASRIHPNSEADALERALLVQKGFRSAQNGVELGALGLLAGASGLVTGAYPGQDEQSERARWQKGRIQPFSLKIGDQYVDLGRYLGPLAFPFMIGAAIGRGKPTAIPQTIGEVTKQFLANYGADSFGDVLSSAGNLMKGNFNEAQNDFDRWAAGITTAFVPASSALNTAGKTQDIVTGSPAPDTGGGYVDSVRSRFPVTRNGLPPRTDTLGNPITQGNAFDLLPGVSGGQQTNRATSDQRPESVMSEIDRLASVGHEVMPARDVKNSNSENDAQLLLDTGVYKNADDKTKADMLHEVLLGSKTKDISPSLDDDERSALIQYAVMDGGESKGQRGAWLDSTKNARVYYKAKFDNAKINGLSDDDKDLGSTSSLKYKMLAARVNDEQHATSKLLQLYEHTTVTEWRNMPDSKLKRQLTALDKARAKAGVSRRSSDHSSPRYYGGSGSSSGSHPKFVFASAPKSLGGVSMADVNQSGYDKADSGYKPIVLAAPTKSTPLVPRRSISVKKGVHL